MSGPRRPPLAPTALDAAVIQGRWHVVATTFPMWLDGRRTEPTFTYSRLRREGERVRFDDSVGYLSKGAPGTIEGIDTQHPDVPTRFTWRGRGWLAAFSSEWDVVALDPDGDWAVITFERTLVTPAGLDVITRSPKLQSDELAAIAAHARADVMLRALLDKMVALPVVPR
jgi:Lipocalin-like domain